MRWTWEAILEISTLLGGLAALVFFYDRFWRRGNRNSPSSRNREVFGLRINRDKPSLYPKGVLIGMTIHNFVSSFCFALLGYRFGLPGQVGFWVLGSLPSYLLAKLFEGPRFKDKYPDADAIFLSGALFTIFGGYFAFALAGLLCYLNGDPDANSLAGSWFAVISGVFCIAEAAIFSYVEARWA
jgi:hypothetical protein